MKVYKIRHKNGEYRARSYGFNRKPERAATWLRRSDVIQVLNHYNDNWSQVKPKDVELVEVEISENIISVVSGDLAIQESVQKRKERELKREEEDKASERIRKLEEFNKLQKELFGTP